MLFEHTLSNTIFMKVNIICKEDVNSWILGKFALRMQECMKELGIECTINKFPDDNADVNHNIVYYEFDGKHRNVDTVMITHIDEIEKLNFVKDNIGNLSMAICMSNQMTHWLTKMGVDKSKLCYADPAHDSCALIKKYVIGIASRVYADGRKRETFFNKFSEDLDPRFFEFRFMGAGWEKQVYALKSKGFSVVYYDKFVRDEYYKFIQSLDYYLYTGTDEGQMGFVDAAAAGVPSIVTPQGYHLDAPDALTYSFWTYEDLISILLKLQSDRQKIIDSVSTWTWMDYTKKHIEIWHYLIGLKKTSSYIDGLNSYIELQNNNIEYDKDFAEKEIIKLHELSDLHEANRKNTQKQLTNIQKILIYVKTSLRKVVKNTNKTV